MKPTHFLFLFIFLILIGRATSFSETFGTEDFYINSTYSVTTLINYWVCDYETDWGTQSDFSDNGDFGLTNSSVLYTTEKGAVLTQGSGGASRCYTNFTKYTFDSDDYIAFYCAGMDNDYPLGTKKNANFLILSNDAYTQGIAIQLDEENNAVYFPYTDLNLTRINTVIGNDCAGATIEYKKLNYTNFNVSYSNLTRITLLSSAPSAWTGGDNGVIDDINVPIEETLNLLPTFDIEDYDPIYCLNGSSTDISLDITASDNNADSIYFYPFWNYDFSPRFLIDNFENDPYYMLSNGWYSISSCTYSINETGATGTGLLLYNDCEDIEFTKNIESIPITSDFSLELQTFVYLNDTAYFDLKNENNESLTSLKIQQKYYLPNTQYYEFSYWNRTNRVVFDNTTYNGILVVDFNVYRSNNTALICIDGYDENSYYGCNHGISVPLHGITSNDTLSLSVYPEYNFGWTAWETDYLMIDEIYYTPADAIDWILYDGTNTIDHTFSDYGDNTLSVYVTDSYHLTQNYMRYDYYFSVMGKCSLQGVTNYTGNGSAILDTSRRYVDSLENGNAIFQQVFFVLMFLFFVFIFVTSRDLPLSLFTTGTLFTLMAWYMSSNLFCTISAFVIAAIGFALMFQNAQ